ncbi:MAG: hypothetical protein IKN75_09275 [Prevotella sp.]|nr:hypothetical protein [Prevotella sp.]
MIHIMEHRKNTYISPDVKIVSLSTVPMMSGSEYINTANQEYDGRPVLARECQPYMWSEEKED